MKLTCLIKLLPDESTQAALTETLSRCNDACNWLSAVAWQAREFRQFSLHKLAYRQCRERFGLSAQVAVRCIAKVADAYKLDRRVQRSFRFDSAQPFDARIFRFVDDETVSIWTTQGRRKIGIVGGDYGKRMLPYRKGEVDLVHRGGEWFLAVTCELPEAEQVEVDDFVGVDLGIVNIAVDSAGTAFSGAKVDDVRRRYAHRRRNLQRRQTKAARRKLKTLKRRQARFQRDVNHQISKAIVAAAERSGCGIALEDLEGIRKRIKARRRHRARLYNWAFAQLRAFIEYKALRAGVPVVTVDPAYTSRTCPVCGHVSKRNRPSRDRFECVCCGLGGPADHIAARNIRARAIVNWPKAAEAAEVSTEADVEAAA